MSNFIRPAGSLDAQYRSLAEAEHARHHKKPIGWQSNDFYRGLSAFIHDVNFLDTQSRSLAEHARHDKQPIKWQSNNFLREMLGVNTPNLNNDRDNYSVTLKRALTIYHIALLGFYVADRSPRSWESFLGGRSWHAYAFGLVSEVVCFFMQLDDLEKSSKILKKAFEVDQALDSFYNPNHSQIRNLAQDGRDDYQPYLQNSESTIIAVFAKTIKSNMSWDDITIQIRFLVTIFTIMSLGRGEIGLKDLDVVLSCGLLFYLVGQLSGIVKSYKNINRTDLSSLSPSSNSSNDGNYGSTSRLISIIRKLHKPIYYAQKDLVSCTSVAIMGHLLMLGAKLASNDRLLCVARQIYVVGSLLTGAYVTRSLQFYPREYEVMRGYNAQQEAAQVVLNVFNGYKQIRAGIVVLDIFFYERYREREAARVLDAFLINKRYGQIGD